MQLKILNVLKHNAKKIKFHKGIISNFQKLKNLLEYILYSLKEKQVYVVKSTSLKLVKLFYTRENYGKAQFRK